MDDSGKIYSITNFLWEVLYEQKGESEYSIERNAAR